jgi:hypothetical protein
MWPHIGRLNLTSCRNPLHKFHRIPTIREIPPDIGFLDTAAKYLSKSFATFDDAMGVEPNLEDGRRIFSDDLNEVADEFDKEAGEGE